MSSFPETGNPKSKKNTFAKLQIIFASLPMHKMLLLSYKDDIRKTLHQGALTIINIVWVIFAGISLLEENSRFERKKKTGPHGFKFQSMSIMAKDDRKLFQCLNAVLHNKPGPLLLGFS